MNEEYTRLMDELKAQMETSAAAKDVIIEGLEKKVEFWKNIAGIAVNERTEELQKALNDTQEQMKETALTNLALGIKVNVLEEQLDEKTKQCQDLQTEYNELLDDYCVLKEEITPLRQLVLINMREKVGILT